MKPLKTKKVVLVAHRKVKNQRFTDLRKAVADNEKQQELTILWKTMKVVLVSPRKSPITDLQEALADNKTHQGLNETTED